MAKWAFKPTEVDSRPCQRHLAGGLQLISYSMRVFGTDLDVGLPRSRFRRCFFQLFTILTLVFVVSGNAVHCYLFPVKEFPKTIYVWCKVLRKSTRIMSSVPFQLAYVSLTLFQWKSVWKKAEKMEQSITFQVDFAQKLRRALFGISTFILAVVKRSV